MEKEPFGILLIDKPEGMTSHDVVDHIRKRGHFRKVGHAGTLDPLATGLLVLLVGGATRRASSFLEDDKSYKATMVLGYATDTGDREGSPIRYGGYHHLTLQKVQEVFQTLLGLKEQIPPMYSAIKYQGKKLYQWARKGLSVERSPRSISIRTLELLEFHHPTLSFFLVCSKGTYVRALIETMGEKLNCPGHLASLRRLRSGPFSVEEALPFEKVRHLDRGGLVRFLQNLPQTKGEAI